MGRGSFLLTLCHPGFWILVITQGGPQDPQLYFGILGLFMPPSNNVEPYQPSGEGGAR